MSETHPHAATCQICGKIFITTSRKPVRFCSKPCIWKATKGPEFNARISRATGAVRADKMRDSGDCTKTYRKRNGRHEHRTIAESILGRPLERGEVVHHIDGNKRNNAPANLLVTTQGAHMREHGLGIPGKPLAHKPWLYRGRK